LEGATALPLIAPAVSRWIKWRCSMLNCTASGKHTRPAGGIDIGQTSAAKYMINERLAIAAMALLVAPTISFCLP
jgi:hypothetical protein